MKNNIFWETHYEGQSMENAGDGSMDALVCNISGNVQDDPTFDGGTTGIPGIILLCIWIFIALVPDVLWIRKMRTYGMDFMWRGLKMIAGVVLTGCAVIILSLVTRSF